MILKKLIVGQLQSNTYIVGDEDTKEVLVIDPGDERKKIFKEISDNGYKVKYIVATHGHGDHVGAVNYIREKTNAKVAIHEEDLQNMTDSSRNLSFYLGEDIEIHDVEVLLKDNDEIKVGKYTYKVIHTPGHTPGSICLLVENKLFSGDTLFYTSIGRTDLPGGNFNSLINSIKEKLYILDDNVQVYPGHGPDSSIGFEKKNNGFVRV